jgi:hypothetical protein
MGASGGRELGPYRHFPRSSGGPAELAPSCFSYSRIERLNRGLRVTSFALSVPTITLVYFAGLIQWSQSKNSACLILAGTDSDA